MKIELNKKQIRSTITLAVALIAYVAIVFIIPFERNASFWVSFVFTLVSIGMQIPVMKISFSGEDVKSKFYGFPIVRIGAIYLAVQVISGFIFMALAKWVPAFVPALIYILLLCAAIAGLVATDSMRDEIERQDIKLKSDVKTMRALQSKAGQIAMQSDGNISLPLKKLAENIRYSDPVSSEATAEMENELSVLLDEIQLAVADGDANGVTELCKRAENVLMERNRICKLNK